MRGGHPKYRSAPHRVPVRRSQPVPMFGPPTGMLFRCKQKWLWGKENRIRRRRRYYFSFHRFFPPPFFFFGPFSPFGARFFI